MQPYKVAPLHTRQDFIAWSQHRLGEVRSQVQHVAALVAHLDILNRSAHGQRHVAWEGPRCGRPGQQIDTRLVLNRKLDVDAGVDRAFFVAQGQFVAAQGRAATWAIGHDFVALIEQRFFPKLLEYPPERLDIFIFEGDVRRGQVDPKGHTVGELLPLADDLQCGGATELVELFHAKGFDLRFAGDAQTLFNFDFNRQPVGIPAAAALDIVALHGLVAREDVLERARQDMVDAGATVGGGGAFKEDILGATLTFAHAALEDITVAP